ncbi:MAG: aspartyl-tRNA(Asn)/glutamyl-tRNA (Gln) amidotransferase subunit B [Parcubacteria group bacterium Gr01-1014_20]|nr:MAG: aspartyl-tRNA(Asn)/glutamyl-tRNA (Gln) amidotransferase subunit B [Parcubacteria group bacterium Gr01-1014_20]
MPEYIPTIGLEIHVELKTETKMFCDSPNNPEEKNPNTNVCPVCLGHPGTLPTINKKAVEAVIKVGMALGGEINKFTKFDRKNYFYPDLPKGYQISQYDQPLVIGGSLNGVKLRRVHLEEDTGRLLHDPSGEGSLVDYNRAGVPLMELVTEPEIKSAEEAVSFAKELQLILRYLGVSTADMERGQMRVEVNISLGKWSKGNWKQGTKVEIKNLNSFSAVSGSIEYETKRQAEVMKTGKVKHETRGWDDVKHVTVSQRSKEEAHDYRYFPEPDLPPLETESLNPEALKISLPELPGDKRERFKKEYNLEGSKLESLIIDQDLAEFFEESVSEIKEFDSNSSHQTLFNYLTSDLVGLIKESGTSFKELKVKPEHLAHLSFLIDSGRIGSRQAKDVLRKMFETGADPEEIIKSENLENISDESELETVIKKIIEANPVAVGDYKKGKTASVQFLVGKAMAELRGRGNPEKLKEIFVRLLT